jgi:hypothetical protein
VTVDELFEQAPSVLGRRIDFEGEVRAANFGNGVIHYCLASAGSPISEFGTTIIFQIPGIGCRFWANASAPMFPLQCKGTGVMIESRVPPYPYALMDCTTFIYRKSSDVEWSHLEMNPTLYEFQVRDILECSVGNESKTRLFMSLLESRVKW